MKYQIKKNLKKLLMIVIIANTAYLAGYSMGIYFQKDRTMRNWLFTTIR